MDSTEQYVVMCEEAEEIQLLYNPKVANCLYSSHIIWDNGWDNLRQYKSYDGYVKYGNSKKYHQFRTYDGYLWHCIWLPRQDQLQDMVWEKPVNEAMEPAALFKQFYEWLHKIKNPNFEYFWKFSSMEQLWLAFTMKEKYNKLWNGTNWILELLNDSNYGQ